MTISHSKNKKRWNFQKKNKLGQLSFMTDKIGGDRTMHTDDAY